MPLYTYECGSCGKREIYLCKMGKKPAKCKLCGAAKKHLKKKMDAPSMTKVSPWS